MAMPPEADPVIPAKVVTLIASDTNGVPPIWMLIKRGYVGKARELRNNIAIADF